METAQILGTAAQTGLANPSQAGAVGHLGSEDFLKMLITQLQYQDPLEPMDNSKLVEQIASVREIELNTTLTDSLRALAGQDRFMSAPALIGQYVTATAQDGTAQQGIVVGVRFTGDGHPLLQLSNGSEVKVEQVSTVEPPLQAAEALVGQRVVGVDRRDPLEMDVVEGIVTAARVDAQGEVQLELDTGQVLRFRDVVNVSSEEMV